MRTERGDRIPLPVLVNALADTGQAGAVLQVVRHTIPHAGLGGQPSNAAEHAYRELVTASGTGPAPMESVTWVAVRLDARSLAESGVEYGVGIHTAAPVVAGLIRSVTKALRPAGISAHVLDSAGLVDALARSTDLAPLAHAPAAPPTPTAPKEEWYGWHSAGLAHRTFWVRKWPPLERAAPLLDQLAIASASMTSVAMILTPRDEAELLDLRCLVRVAAPAARLRQVCEVLATGARRAHAELFPLDGEQGPAVYASAPTGGGAL
jgi:type VII secretion protein EccE